MRRKISFSCRRQVANHEHLTIRFPYNYDSIRLRHVAYYSLFTLRKARCHKIWILECDWRKNMEILAGYSSLFSNGVSVLAWTNYANRTSEKNCRPFLEFRDRNLPGNRQKYSWEWRITQPIGVLILHSQKGDF